MNCQYCDKNFSNKSNLFHHQKTAVYCLKNKEQYIQIENKALENKVITGGINTIYFYVVDDVVYL